MNDNTESELRREVEELRAEVKYLKNLIEWGLVIVGIGLALLFQDLVGLAILIGILILLGILASPFRRLISSILFGKRNKAERDV